MFFNRLLLKLCKFVIFIRCGNIAGSQYLPVWNDNDLILLLLQGVILSQTAPDINWQVYIFSIFWYSFLCSKYRIKLQVELSPVDFIADSVVKLTMNVTTMFGKIFHFINSNTMDCR